MKSKTEINIKINNQQIQQDRQDYKRRIARSSIFHLLLLIWIVIRGKDNNNHPQNNLIITITNHKEIIMRINPYKINIKLQINIKIKIEIKILTIRVE